MKHLKHIAASILAIVCMGATCVYASERYPNQIVLAQHNVVVRGAHVVPVQPQQRTRRFVMVPNGAVYQRGVNPQYKTGRMSAEERRALRRQINEANQGIYYKKP
jgi:hypothetical protein